MCDPAYLAEVAEELVIEILSTRVETGVHVISWANGMVLMSALGSFATNGLAKFYKQDHRPVNVPGHISPRPEQGVAVLPTASGDNAVIQITLVHTALILHIQAGHICRSVHMFYDISLGESSMISCLTHRRRCPQDPVLACCLAYQHQEARLSSSQTVSLPELWF